MDENSEIDREAKYRMYCDQRMAQEIRENSQELRELETRIRAAYVTKALKLQLAEREKQRLLEKIRIENDIQRMKQKLHDDAERDRQRKEELRLQQEKHRKELLEQIADKQFKRKILYEEFLKEKIIIDEIMAQIEREQIEYKIAGNCLRFSYFFLERKRSYHCILFFFVLIISKISREMQERLQKTECLREDIVRLIEEQEEWRKQQKLIEEQENEKIMHYIQEQEEQRKRYEEMEHKKRIAIREQQEKMCAKLDEIEVKFKL